MPDRDRGRAGVGVGMPDRDRGRVGVGVGPGSGRAGVGIGWPGRGGLSGGGCL